MCSRTERAFEEMQRSVLGTVDSNVLEKAPGRQKRLRRAPQGDGEGCGSDGERGSAHTQDHELVKVGLLTKVAWLI